MTPTSPPSPAASGAPSSLCLLCGAANPASATSCQTCGSPLSPIASSMLDEGDFSGFARALPPQTALRGGDYHVLGVLGQGGFGITYRALNQRLEREVAIKEFFPATCERVGRSVSASGGLSGADFDSLRAAFLEEARILARFELPAVVRVMGAWEENASAYMEMEILRGPTMAQVLEERERLPVEATIALFEPVLEALDVVHAAGWLHRDIKPHNIIFEPHIATPASVDPKRLDLGACRAVLLDFGAAKKVAANVSQSFSVIVTPGYAPLEQYATRARRGAFTDVYALCATLYHALTGQAPPPASDRALHDDLIPVRELRPDVPPVIARAIEEGLRTAISQRPQTMSELRELLHGRGAFQVAVQEAALESRDPKAHHLKARQQSILSNIQSINQPGSGEPSAQQKLIASLPVTPEALQMLHAAQSSPPLSSANRPLPQARPTGGGASGSGGHKLRHEHAPGTWSNGVYMTAIGIGLLMLATAGPILNALFSRPPTPPPTYEPRAYELPAPRPAPPHTLLSTQPRTQNVVDGVQISPDGRHSFGRARDEQGCVWDVASGRRVLSVGEVAPGDSAHWSPDSKYLLVVQCASNTHPSRAPAYDVRLFRVDKPGLAWRRSIQGNVSEPVWWIKSDLFELRIDGEKRFFSPLDDETRGIWR